MTPARGELAQAVEARCAMGATAMGFLSPELRGAFVRHCDAADALAAIMDNPHGCEGVAECVQCTVASIDYDEARAALLAALTEGRDGDK